MPNDIVRFKSGSITNLLGDNNANPVVPALTIIPGTVYFAIDENNKGSIYFDKDSTHRIQMGGNHAETADVAEFDTSNNRIEDYIKNITFENVSNGTAARAILTKGTGNTVNVDLPNAGASSAGVITAGAQTIAGAKTFTGAFTASGGVTFSNANFNYSGMEAGAQNADRVVWFSDNVTTGKPVYDTDFKYNPYSNTLTVTNLNGTATYATYADGDSGNDTIQIKYIASISADNNNHQFKYYNGIGDESTIALPYVLLAGDTMTGTLVLSKTQVASGTANYAPALIVGGVATAAHLELDKNQIMAKTNGTSIADLYINKQGGSVFVGGPLKIGNNDSYTDSGYITDDTGLYNYITFFGTYLDGITSGEGQYNHTFIGESVYGNSAVTNNLSELLLFHGGEPIITDGPDRIRLYSGEIEIQVYTTTTFGNWNTIRQQSGITVANFARNRSTLNGAVEIYPTQDNYNQGIRVHAYNGWSGILLGGSDLNNVTDTSANSWYVGNNNGNFYITKNGNTDSTKDNFSFVDGYWRLHSTKQNNLNKDQTILYLYGSTYGNTAADLISNTAGVLSYGDGGPQIVFSTNATPGAAHDGAIIFTDNNVAGGGASWHFVSNQTDWNVISKRFHARTSVSIGTNLPNTSYNLYVNGTTNITGNTTIGGDIIVAGDLAVGGSISFPDITIPLTVTEKDANGRATGGADMNLYNALLDYADTALDTSTNKFTLKEAMYRSMTRPSIWGGRAITDSSTLALNKVDKDIPLIYFDTDSTTADATDQSIYASLLALGWTDCIVP